MIRPEEEGPAGASPAPDVEHEPPAQDFWAYVQDERQRYPRLWRVLVRVHTRAFRLAFPEYSLRDVWKLSDAILRDVIVSIESQADSALAAAPRRFQLQMPVFPAEKQAANFEGTWRGWLTIGKPELVH